ncbi:MAG TPA: hypothetical protein VL481_02410 [Verrucomicrobiae bacterium]|nr:hypothetical protein [Verrucomicrobiae bacterium]
MYTLKSIVRRGTPLAAIVAMVAASVLPATSVFADALNPLTDRSLALSSSSPGWSNSDGSENSTYAPPNSGANGQKTGNTFSFKTSTAANIKAFSFQYCTSPAGNCTNPGNDTTPGTDDFANQKSDLDVVTSSPAEVGSSDFGTIVDTNSANATFGQVIAVPGYAGYDNGKPGAGHETGIGGAGAAVAGNFVVYYFDGTDWLPSSGWSMAATTQTDVSTTKHNYITLSNASGSLAATAGMPIKVVFFGTTDNYIQNPGAGAFFVRMNTYSDAAATTILDGGVTVANVMNQSIWIQTKVLETMDFSVGTVDPNTLDSTDHTGSTPSQLEQALYATTTGMTGQTQHGICDRILGNITPGQPTNVLKLGDQSAESSLRTDSTFSTHSYWRLSSNSSAGATVYYSGHTLTNTVGDEIKAIGPTKALPIHGSEQFGLALDNTDQTGTSQSDLKVSYAQEATYENGNDTGLTGIHASTTADVNGNASWHDPTLYPLLPAANYYQGTGAINSAPSAQFAFVRTSDTTPVPIASENSQVVDCVTGKMRYIANIAATTPAGIYTTKVNYIAAPQY